MYRYHPFYTPVQRPYPPAHAYPNTFIPNPYYYRNLPPVHTQVFMESSKKMLPLLQSAQTVVDKVSNSDQFSKQLMDAAQNSNPEAVKKIIASTGIPVIPAVDFNPDGINLIFDAKSGGIDCCHLVVKIRWRDL